MSESVFKHNLGDRVKDYVSGMVGVITSRGEHLFGCNRYWVEPQELKDGKPVEGKWFDEESIELVEAGVIKRTEYARVAVPAVAEVPSRRAGGPTTQPSSASPQNGR
jgi:hypothetical protein